MSPTVNAVRRHLSYSNVAATLALVFAMSGSAIAAKHYLLSSTKQISPSVLKQLQGRAGRTGAQGPPGAPGALGPRGNEGKGLPGPQGERGEAGISALSQLPPERTESGSYGVRVGNGTTSGFVLAAVTFPIPLEADIQTSHIVYTSATVPVAHCSGPRHADPGYLCVYELQDARVGQPEFFNAESESEEEEGEGTGRSGLIIGFRVTGAEPLAWGSYAVTAP